jgi:hypothetical protein
MCKRKQSGLLLELFTGSSGPADYFATKNGMYVVIHNRNNFPIMRYEGIYVDTGVATNVGVSRAWTHKLDSPYSSCRKDTSAKSTDNSIFVETANITKYSQKLCSEVCLQYKYILPNCGCKDPTIPQSNIYAVSQFCHTTAQFDCVQQQRGYFDQNSISLEEF